MYLRAKEKTTGVENFHIAAGSKLISPDLAGKVLSAKPAKKSGDAAKTAGVKPLAIGVLGAGQQGQRLLRALAPRPGAAAYAAVMSIADVRPSRRDLAKEAAADAHIYESYEKLLAAAKDDGLQAVIVALPSHLHAPAALAALDAGLHVFIEPPMALTVADAKKICKKAEEKSRCVAVGQQRRYSPIYEYALEMVRRDLLDQVHYVRSQWHVALPEKIAAATTEEEKRAAEKKAKDDKLKYRLDWWREIPEKDVKSDLAGYGSVEELVRWQLYGKYSGGLVAELGSQLFDAAVMLIEASPNRDRERPYPLSVAGSAGQVLRDAAGDIDDHVHCIFEYAIDGYTDAKEVPPKARKKIALQFDMILGSNFDSYGETVLGRKGSLVLESERRPMLFYQEQVDKNVRLAQPKEPAKKAAAKDEPKKEEKKDEAAKPSVSLEVSKDGKTDETAASLAQLSLRGDDGGFAAELEHWAGCCQTMAAGKPRCDARTGLYTAVLVTAAAKAIELGTRIDFNPDWFDPSSDKTPDGL